MKKFTFFSVLFSLFIAVQALTAQNQNENFKMSGPKSVTVEVNETYTSPTEISPFRNNDNKIYGLAVTASVELLNNEGWVRLLLVDDKFEEYLIYEGNSLLEEGLMWSVEEICEETDVLEGVKAQTVKIELENATLTLGRLVYATQLDPTVKIDKEKKEKKQGRNEEKIRRINENLKRQGKSWVAGPTEVSELSYAEKQLLYGQSTFPPAFEYYAGGVISTGTSDSEEPSLKSATASQYVNEWDWRNRHGQNWITPVVNQGLCGSCWAFAATGATEAMVNLFYNQLLNLDLSEQDLLSCSGAGGCSGGYPSTALNYIAKTGIVDEGAFPYSESDESCQNKSKNPEELIKIAGRVDFGSSLYPRSEDNLKKMLIEMGPISGGLYDWSHAMVLVGYKVVEEGDKFYYRDLYLKRYWITIEAGNTLIGKTVWIFKNSWGNRIGDGGYIYVETPITNMGWTHALKTPVISGVKNYEVICEDKDGDGYYWWGLGEKPETCDCPDEPDGDDSDPTLGPLDEYGNCLNLTPVLTLVNVPAGKNLGINPELPTCDTEVKAVNGCSEETVTCTPGEITENGCEKSQSFTYTATDNCNNTVSATVTYTWIEDLIPPVLVNVPVSQNLGINPELPTCNSGVSAFDACGEATVTCNPGEIVKNGDERSLTFTYTATDESGNRTTDATTYTWTEKIVGPQADFTATGNLFAEGETVQFEDLSSHSPESWSWKFEGGTPATSTYKNPPVRYDKPGKFGVTLTVTNAGGSDTKTVENFITVEENLPEYCASKGNGTEEWIASVTLNAQTHQSGSTGATGYQDFSGTTAFTAEAGTRVNISLTPGFLNRWQYQYWRIWIDYNGDTDFDDAGELVYTSSRSKGEVTGSFTIPQGVAGTSRMRISMKRDAA
ncbi:MAG: PKD domain-containing protein, partial [Mariniphaga sp.]|nr:PKD domain-containing protein [Mariniphaga sp.]